MHLFFRHNCTRHHQVHLAETVQTFYITEAKKKLPQQQHNKPHHHLSI